MAGDGSTTEASALPARGNTQAPGAMLASVGLFVAVLALAVVIHPRTQNYTHDGKVLYLGARALWSGANPYATPELVEAASRLGPNGAAGSFIQVQVPGTLVLIGAVAWLPWAVFKWGLVAVNCACVVVVARAGLRLAGWDARAWHQVLATGAVVAFPSTYQIIVLGQVSFVALACLLLLVAALRRHAPPAVVALATLGALVKVTVALPLLALVFLRGGCRARQGMIAGACASAVLSGAAVARIGVARFLEGYRQSAHDLFGPGGFNDPFRAGNVRLDAQSVFALFASRATLPLAVAALLGLGALLVLALWWRRPRGRVAAAEVGALSLLALVAFYHLMYDGLLALPAAFAAAGALLRPKRKPARRAAALLVLVPLLLFAASLGNHNLLDLVLRRVGHGAQPTWFRPALALLCCLIGAARVLVPRCHREPGGSAAGLARPSSTTTQPDGRTL